jgi:hypothetical protein
MNSEHTRLLIGYIVLITGIFPAQWPLSGLHIPVIDVFLVTNVIHTRALRKDRSRRIYLSVQREKRQRTLLVRCALVGLSDEPSMWASGRSKST